MVVIECIPQTVVDHHIGHGGVVHAGAPAGGIDGVGREAHVLHAAGHDALGLAGQNGAVCQADAVQTGAADLIQRGTGRLDGQTGLQRSLTGRVLAQSSLQDIAEEDFVHILGVHIAALQRFLDNDAAKLHSGNTLQRAAKAAHGRTGHAYQIHFFHCYYAPFFILKRFPFPLSVLPTEPSSIIAASPLSFNTQCAGFYELF